MKTKINDVEESVNFVSKKFDDWQNDKIVLEKKMTELSTKVETVADLKLENTELRENLIDQRCRSMRDNLIFTNIPEEPNETWEHSERVLRTFIKEQMIIESSELHFKRVHRIGQKRLSARGDEQPRPRPLIARFLYTRERDTIKYGGKALKGKPYGVVEQFPEEIAQYRRDVLMPRLRAARREGKRANIVIDKLYIDNREEITPPPPYRVPRQVPDRHTRGAHR